MAVYVDDARIKWRGYRMCHMIADSSFELDEMAETLGLKQHWKQKPFEPDEHFDITWTIRKHAIILGAIPITQRQLAEKIAKRRTSAVMKSAEAAS